jgi:hypothetical protein
VPECSVLHENMNENDIVFLSDINSSSIEISRRTKMTTEEIPEHVSSDINAELFVNEYGLVTVTSDGTVVARLFAHDGHNVGTLNVCLNYGQNEHDVMVASSCGKVVVVFLFSGFIHYIRFHEPTRLSSVRQDLSSGETHVLFGTLPAVTIVESVIVCAFVHGSGHVVKVTLDMDGSETKGNVMLSNVVPHNVTNIALTLLRDGTVITNVATDNNHRSMTYVNSQDMEEISDHDILAHGYNMFPIGDMHWGYIDYEGTIEFNNGLLMQLPCTTIDQSVLFVTDIPSDRLRVVSHCQDSLEVHITDFSLITAKMTDDVVIANNVHRWACSFDESKKIFIGITDDTLIKHEGSPKKVPFMIFV